MMLLGTKRAAENIARHHVPCCKVFSDMRTHIDIMMTVNANVAGEEKEEVNDHENDNCGRHIAERYALKSQHPNYGTQGDERGYSLPPPPPCLPS